MKYIYMILGTILFLIRFISFFIWLLLIGTVAMYFYHFRNGWNSVRILSYCAQLWAKGEAWIFGLKVKVHGDLKKHAGMIISNHVSYMDIFLLGATFPLRYSPKDDIRSWPVLGWGIGLSKPIWIDRTSKHGSLKVLKDFKETVANGINLVAFPEGTTSSGIGNLLPFKSTAFEASISGGFPLYPVLIKYKDDAIAWYGDGDPLLLHAWKVLSKWKIEAKLYILPPITPLQGMKRKEFSLFVYDQMNKSFNDILKNK